MHLIASTALLALASLAVATTPATRFMVDGNHKFQCRRVNRVNWRKFEFEKKVVTLVVKDARGNILGQQNVRPDDGFADVFFPEYFDRVARFALVDTRTSAVFAEGEDISIDCPKRDGNSWNGDQPWDNNRPWDSGVSAEHEMDGPRGGPGGIRGDHNFGGDDRDGGDDRGDGNLSNDSRDDEDSDGEDSGNQRREEEVLRSKHHKLLDGMRRKGDGGRAAPSPLGPETGGTASTPADQSTETMLS
ncbi:hypothetical protein D9756_002098 [Leucocoprinus leucothites]|uniref:Uncharacterized protein n=1 Tax=Leucocoprinus leucothites TaxID=201217 RepID=A0A8H5GBN3_9AGAR|nr:hypothetical protein D9756_002098 [Leucoagaricus leucothites]